MVIAGLPLPVSAAQPWMGAGYPRHGKLSTEGEHSEHSTAFCSAAAGIAGSGSGLTVPAALAASVPLRGQPVLCSGMSAVLSLSWELAEQAVPLE